MSETSSHPPDDDLPIVLAKLAGLRDSIEAGVAGDISYTGWGADRTSGYLGRLAEYVEELRALSPALFGDLPRRRWGVSIASQKDDLREAGRDLREVFARATHAGMWKGGPYVPPTVTRSPSRSWFSEHLWQLLVGLAIAYIVYRLGWNR